MKYCWLGLYLFVSVVATVLIEAPPPTPYSDSEPLEPTFPNGGHPGRKSNTKIGNSEDKRVNITFLGRSAKGKNKTATDENYNKSKSFDEGTSTGSTEIFEDNTNSSKIQDSSELEKVPIYIFLIPVEKNQGSSIPKHEKSPDISPVSHFNSGVSRNTPGNPGSDQNNYENQSTSSSEGPLRSSISPGNESWKTTTTTEVYTPENIHQERGGLPKKLGL